MPQPQFIADNNQSLQPTTLWLWLSWCALAIIGRVIPHLPDMTPMLGLSVLCWQSSGRWHSILLITVSMLISNLILAAMYHYPLIGIWSLWSIAGILALAFISEYLPRHPKYHNLSLYTQTMLLSVVYWAWLNAQTWICTPLYSHTWSGLMTSEWMGLPFLGNMLIGDSLFLALGIGLTYFNRAAKQSPLDKNFTLPASTPHQPF